MKRDDVYFQAMQSRDHRFDGKFFVGVKTTGIYCRPICPARPKRENVEFFSNFAEAERAGYRPCLRCRPESAPKSPAWIGKTAIVQRAVKVLHSREPIELNEDEFADRFGISARHLRRLFKDEIGKTPKQLSTENRLNLARNLISETSLQISDIAFASGFRSVRRFNDAFRERFKKSPSEIRRTPLGGDGSLKLSLSYRPPFNFEAIMAHYWSHRIGSLEWFDGDVMNRIIAFDGKVGQISISNDATKSRLLLEVDFQDSSRLHSIISQVRSMFDLDSDPIVIANAIEFDPELKKILRKHLGIRLPSGWDPFETGIAIILGQLVSVERGRSLVSDLVEMLGEDSGIIVAGRNIRLFPSARSIAASDLAGLKTTLMRKKTLRVFSESVALKRISLEPTQDVEKFIEQILDVPGIGPWTASYMALKCLRHTDSFPETDLILARALELHSKDVVEKISPWRGYAAALLWREYAGVLQKTKSVGNPKGIRQ